ncbi:MAG: methyltransferase domain-containing protein [Thermoleophilia bacterium]
MSHDETRIQGDPSLELVLELAAPSVGDRVIDVGTTVGATAFALAGAVASVLAVDNRPDTIDEALRLSREVGADNVGFALANLYALPFADGAFTLATCRNALHRFPEPVAALNEIARVVTASGRLVVYDLLVSAELDKSLNELARLSDPSHRRYATHDEFLEQFAKAGLTVTQERRLHRTVDLEYWLEAAAVDTGRAGLIRTRLQELPLKVQTALDLAVSDDLVSFSYDDIGFRLERT